MEFWEHKTELFCFLYLIEGMEVVINLMDDDVWEAEYEQIWALNENVEIWDWIYL